VSWRPGTRAAAASLVLGALLAGALVDQVAAQTLTPTPPPTATPAPTRTPLPEPTALAAWPTPDCEEPDGMPTAEPERTTWFVARNAFESCRQLGYIVQDGRAERDLAAVAEVIARELRRDVQEVEVAAEGPWDELVLLPPLMDTITHGLALIGAVLLGSLLVQTALGVLRRGG
jgi:hypothetical protein